jgi:hypothetical protein
MKDIYLVAVSVSVTEEQNDAKVIGQPIKITKAMSQLSLSY